MVKKMFVAIVLITLFFHVVVTPALAGSYSCSSAAFTKNADGTWNATVSSNAPWKRIQTADNTAIVGGPQTADNFFNMSLIQGKTYVIFVAGQASGPWSWTGCQYTVSAPTAVTITTFTATAVSSDQVISATSSVVALVLMLLMGTKLVWKNLS